MQIVLDGKTDIKDGMTYSKFETVPDAPIQLSTTLPEGPHSILAAARRAKRLCGQSLVMPTMITAQNGKQIKQTTKIAVTGCGAVKIEAVDASAEAQTGAAAVPGEVQDEESETCRVRHACAQAIRTDRESQQDQPEGQVNAYPENPYSLPTHDHRIRATSDVTAACSLGIRIRGCPNEQVRAESKIDSATGQTLLAGPARMSSV